MIQPGEYEFTVVEAVDKFSQAGNAVINLLLQFDAIILRSGEPLRTYDNLVDTPNALWKSSQFALATGMMAKGGEPVDFTAQDCIGRTGRAMLNLGKPNQNGRQFMEVKWYCEPKGFSEQPAPARQAKPKPAAQPRPTQQAYQPRTAQPLPAGTPQNRQQPQPPPEHWEPPANDPPGGDEIPY
jgi:hypothetical protein